MARLAALLTWCLLKKKAGGDSYTVVSQYYNFFTSCGGSFFKVKASNGVLLEKLVRVQCSKEEGRVP